jgi:uncharacterized protein (TIGR02300 family)
MARALTGRLAYGKARPILPEVSPSGFTEKPWRIDPMVKPEWGTKRTCPKCATRFYDLGKEDPVTCIECGTEWMPEPVLKSKQPLPFEAADTSKKPEKADSDLSGDDDEDLNIDEDEEPSADDEVDLSTGDDDIRVSTGDDDDDN